MRNLGQGNSKPKINFPDPTNPHKRENRNGLVKYAQQAMLQNKQVELQQEIEGSEAS